MLLFAPPQVSAATTSCTSCTDCSSKLDGTYDQVNLTQDILNHPGNCITVQGANVTLDCGGHTLKGTDTGIGIFNDGNNGVTIQNCKITRFSIGIGLNVLSSNNLTGNEITDCGRGIRMAGVSNSTLSGNIVRYSDNEGIQLISSNTNQLNSNESCANVEWDIDVVSGTGNTGTGNRCDDPHGWKDTGSTTGCTLACTVCDDFDGDGVCDTVDNCPFDPNADQNDSDSDGVGDVCDNCPNVQNSGQANSDLFDDYGDVCDNCWLKADASQLDGDGDCAPLKLNSAYWDGTKWLKDPHCGDPCDNCSGQSNPYQEDKDADDVGDLCDNCPDDANPWQEDYDNDTYGDVCDNCWLRANPDQANADGDNLGDVCDNCWYVKNPDQHDTDNDCKALPPYSQDPHCGNACDNCPTWSNWLQEDWDGDNEGDACDCNDKLMGENEDGADCGGLCTATCPAGCVPIFKHGDPKGKIDVVFIPTLEYTSLDEFRDDARDNGIFKGFLKDPTLSANKTKINFWYVNKVAPFTNTGSYFPCQWKEPGNWRTVCPQASLGVILHRNKCRDSRVGDAFSAQAECWRSFLHEFGHAAIGLQDEYDDCSTSYKKCPGSYCNIYDTKNACTTGSTNPSKCRKFTSCAGDWWTSQPTYTMMAQYCGPLLSCVLCTWGPDGDRAVKDVLGNYTLTGYADPPADDARKAIVGYFLYNGLQIALTDVEIVYGDSPERYLDWDKLGLYFLDSSGTLVNGYGISDPRYVDYVDPVGAEILDQVDFASVFPFIENLKFLEVQDLEAGEVLATFDLSPAIREFCGEHPEDPQCISYDSDGDGLPDREDACVESDMEETITIESCESGVENRMLEQGCTMSDEIAECADPMRNHGGFVSCVAALTDDWKKDGLITGEESGRIQNCAAQSSLAWGAVPAVSGLP